MMEKPLVSETFDGARPQGHDIATARKNVP
jgi:hypothetical protein